MTAAPLPVTAIFALSLSVNVNLFDSGFPYFCPSTLDIDSDSVTRWNGPAAV